MCQEFFQNQSIDWLEDLDHSNYLLDLSLQDFIQTRSTLDMGENLPLTFGVAVSPVVRDDTIMSVTAPTTNGTKCSGDTSSLSDPVATLDPQSVSIGSAEPVGASAIDNGSGSSPCHDFSPLPHGQPAYTAQSPESRIADPSAAVTAQLLSNILSEPLEAQVGAETPNEEVHSRLGASNPSLVDCDQLCHSTAAPSHAEVIKSTAKSPPMHGGGLSPLSGYTHDNTFVATPDDTKPVEAQSLEYNNSKLSVATATEESGEASACGDSTSATESMRSSTPTPERRVFVDVNMRSTKCIKKTNKRGTKEQPVFVDSDNDDSDERSDDNNVKRRRIEKGLSCDNILKPSDRIQGEREMETTGGKMRPTTRSRLHKEKKEIGYSAKHHPMDIFIRPERRLMATPRSKRVRADTARTPPLARSELRKLGEQIQQTFLRHRDEMQALLDQQDRLLGSIE